MSAIQAHPKIDARRYGRLLSRAIPRPIRDDDDLDAATAKLLKLDELDEAGKLSSEEREYSELLTVLIERYEQERYPVPDGTPHENLIAAMEHRGITQAELSKIIGSRSLTSEILSGRKEISKAVAKKLAALFRAPIEMFI